jgi:hypothetical protein
MDSINSYASSDEEGAPTVPVNRATSSSVKINSAPNVGGEVSDVDVDPKLTMI